MNYLQSEADVQRLIVEIKLMRQLLQSSSFDEFRGREIASGAEVQNDEEIEVYIQDASSTVYHPVGTCKMGADKMAVVDPELEVRGIDELRVVDAPIMPMTTTGNTSASTIMIGEKATDFIKASRTRQTLMTQYNVQNPAHLAYLGVGD